MWSHTTLSNLSKNSFHTVFFLPFFQMTCHAVFGIFIHHQLLQWKSFHRQTNVSSSTCSSVCCFAQTCFFLLCAVHRVYNYRFQAGWCVIKRSDLLVYQVTVDVIESLDWKSSYDFQPAVFLSLIIGGLFSLLAVNHCILCVCVWESVCVRVCVWFSCRVSVKHGLCLCSCLADQSLVVFCDQLSCCGQFSFQQSLSFGVWSWCDLMWCCWWLVGGGWGDFSEWATVCKPRFGVCYWGLIESDMFIYACCVCIIPRWRCLSGASGRCRVMKAGFLDGCTYQTFCSRGGKARNTFLLQFQAALGRNLERNSLNHLELILLLQQCNLTLEFTLESD